MELQAKIDAFVAAGAVVYSLSYDEVDALADFRDAYETTITLLSDPDSRVIRELGVLNTLIKSDDHPWFGVPFPGTYIVDEDGVVSAKFFNQSFALRPGPEILLRALRPDVPESHAAVRELPTETRANVRIDGERLIVSVMRELAVRIEVPADRYVCAPPATANRIAPRLRLQTHPRLVVGEIALPAGEPLIMAASGETVQVYAGVIELRVPLAVNTNLADAAIYQREDITFAGDLRWQTIGIDGSEQSHCETFELTSAVGPALRSELTTPVDGDVVRAMNGMQHFQQLAARRGITDLSKIMPG